ncbi:FliA/WhiG family RNA polymerase sigma factor [Pseudonocardia acaciae]|uniref:FliA/WhiG family RNA polymerase sigma factor n=1 Tax=Pseudonocardia acaciae TaxID=551276 RepID=UPI000687E5C2|nr:FliA/WhiG family RNA polymerase sigma factor [Pseudonocardia acaciae]
MTKLILEPERPLDGNCAPPEGADGRGAEPLALWGEYFDCGARQHRDRLVLHYASLVRRVAGRLGTRLPAHVELADLTQAGVFGLMDAIERFEPELGVRFEAYAAQRIRGAILDELRAQDWVPRVVRNRARELAKAREAVEARLHRPATAGELAEELGIDQADVRGILGGLRLISAEALDERSSSRGATVTIAETLAEEGSDPIALFEARETSRLLWLSLARLGERDRRVLRMYYLEDRTLAEIGALLGVTESRACQLRGRAVSRLREEFATVAGTAAGAG